MKGEKTDHHHYLLQAVFTDSDKLSLKTPLYPETDCQSSKQLNRALPSECAINKAMSVINLREGNEKPLSMLDWGRR